MKTKYTGILVICLLATVFPGLTLSAECEFTAPDNNSPKYVNATTMYRYIPSRLFRHYRRVFGPITGIARRTINYQAEVATDPVTPCSVSALTAAQFPYRLSISRPEPHFFILSVTASAANRVARAAMPTACRSGACVRVGSSFVSAVGIGEPALYSTYYTFSTIVY